MHYQISLISCTHNGRCLPKYDLVNVSSFVASALCLEVLPSSRKPTFVVVVIHRVCVKSVETSVNYLTTLKGSFVISRGRM